jgi:hypothetical protein
MVNILQTVRPSRVDCRRYRQRVRRSILIAGDNNEPPGHQAPPMVSSGFCEILVTSVSILASIAKWKGVSTL